MLTCGLLGVHVPTGGSQVPRSFQVARSLGPLDSPRVHPHGHVAWEVAGQVLHLAGEAVLLDDMDVGLCVHWPCSHMAQEMLDFELPSGCSEEVAVI